MAVLYQHGKSVDGKRSVQMLRGMDDLRVAWDYKSNEMFVHENETYSYFYKYYPYMSVTQKHRIKFIDADQISQYYITESGIVELCAIHRTNVFKIFWETVYMSISVILNIPIRTKYLWTESQALTRHGNTDKEDDKSDRESQPNLKFPKANDKNFLNGI